MEEQFPELVKVGSGNFSLHGFQVKDGWYRLVSGALTFLDQVRRRTGEPVVIQQIKEQYGTLKISHMAPATPLERDVLALLGEEVSKSICDVCGAPGRCGDEGGWIATRCDDHRDILFQPAAPALREAIAQRLSAEPPAQGLLMPDDCREFLITDCFYRENGDRYRIRRFKVDSATLPDVSGRPLDDLLVPVSDLLVDKAEGQKAIRRWRAEGVLVPEFHRALPRWMKYWWEFL